MDEKLMGFRSRVYLEGLVRHIEREYGFIHGEAVPMEGDGKGEVTTALRFRVQGVGWSWSEEGGLSRAPEWDDAARETRVLVDTVRGAADFPRE